MNSYSHFSENAYRKLCFRRVSALRRASNRLGGPEVTRTTGISEFVSSSRDMAGS